MTIVKASDVQAIERFPGVKVRALLDQERGTASVTMGELVVEPGGHLPAHTHLVEEAFFIYEGEGIAVVGKEEHPVVAGMALLAPAGTPHGFKNNTSSALRIVFMYPTLNPKAVFLES